MGCPGIRPDASTYGEGFEKVSKDFLYGFPKRRFSSRRPPGPHGLRRSRRVFKALRSDESETIRRHTPYIGSRRSGGGGAAGELRARLVQRLSLRFRPRERDDLDDRDRAQPGDRSQAQGERARRGASGRARGRVAAGHRDQRRGQRRLPPPAPMPRRAWRGRPRHGAARLSSGIQPRGIGAEILAPRGDGEDHPAPLSGGLEGMPRWQALTTKTATTRRNMRWARLGRPTATRSRRAWRAIP